MCGRAAVRAAARGVSGVMVTLARQPGSGYRASTGLAPLERIAGVERGFPTEWRNPEGNDVGPEFLKYAAPLVGEVAGYEGLE